MLLSKLFNSIRLVLTTADPLRKWLLGESVLEVYSGETKISQHVVTLLHYENDNHRGYDLRLDPTPDGGAWWSIYIDTDALNILRYFVLDILVGAVMHKSLWQSKQDELKAIQQQKNELFKKMLQMSARITELADHNNQLSKIIRERADSMDQRSEELLGRAVTIERLEMELSKLHKEHAELIKRTGELVNTSMKSQEQLQLIGDVAAGDYELGSEREDGQAETCTCGCKCHAKDHDQPWMLPEHQAEVDARVRNLNAHSKLLEAQAAELIAKNQLGQGATHETAATAAGMPDYTYRPCPKCGGKDRYRINGRCFNCNYSNTDGTDTPTPIKDWRIGLCVAVKNAHDPISEATFLVVRDVHPSRYKGIIDPDGVLELKGVGSKTYFRGARECIIEEGSVKRENPYPSETSAKRYDSRSVPEGDMPVQKGPGANNWPLP